MTKTHTMRSRLISLVLVLVMVLGCLPLSALAADPTLVSTFEQNVSTPVYGDFNVAASVTTGYQLQTVGSKDSVQDVGMTLQLYYTGGTDITDGKIRIQFYDANAKNFRLVDLGGITYSSGSFSGTPTVISYDVENGTTADDPAWRPTVTYSGKSIYIQGIRVTLTGSGSFPLKASLSNNGGSLNVGNAGIQLLGSFDIKGYSVDVPTVNLTFDLDATDAYYAYSTVTIEKDKEYILPTVKPIRENYNFKGWKDANGNDVTGSISGDETGTDLRLIAQWEPIAVTSRTVTYSAGDSVTDANYIPSTATVVEGSEYTIPAVIPTRPGYTFVQWIDAGNTVHQPGDTITVNGDVTLTAEWTENTVTITWPTLPTGVTGSTGWNENTTTTEGEGATVTFKLNLTAGYDPSTLTVTANGAALVGVNTTGTTVYEYSFVASSDTTIAVSAPSKLAYTVLLPSGNFTAAFTAPTEYANQTSAVVEYGEGYTFTVKPNKGYKILAIYVNGVKDTGTAAADGTYTVSVTNVTGAQNIRVDAEEVQTYAVTFVVPQLGQTLVQYVDENGKATEPVVDPILAGYDFVGWYTGEEYNNTNGTAYDFEAKVTGDLVLYGKLTAKTYTVTYNGNGNGDVEGIKSPQDKKHGEALTLHTQVPTRPGYTFLGWSTTADGAVVYQPGEVYSTDANITLYAVWQKNTYTVTLPSGAGYTVTPAGMGTVEYGEDFTFTVVVDRAYAATEPTVTATDSQSRPVTVSRTGEKSDISAVTYTYTIEDVTDNISVSITVAQNKTYTVNFYQSFDGTAAADPFNVQMVEHGYYTTAPVAPEVDGYTFQGWFKEAAGTNKFDFTQIITEDTSIYAVYKQKTYEVKNPIAGTGWVYSAQSASPVKHGEDFSFTVTVKEGYDATNMVVGVNGFVLAPDSVEASDKDTVYSYTIRNITEDKAISVTGVVRKTVTIVYNNNGGIGGPTTQVVKYYLVDDNGLISTIKPTRDGYTFLGWAKADADGSIPTAPVYSNPANTEEPVTSNIADFTEDTVLYAVWARAESDVTLAVDPTEQYEGSEVTLTATVPSGGTGSVLFYRDNADPDSDELVGTSNVSGDKATATVVVKDYVAGAETDSFYAVFKPTDGAGYQESTSAVVSVTVRSTAITWGVDAGVVQSKLDITGTLDAEGNMIAGQTYTLTIPVVYALDNNTTPVTDYTVTWEKKTADGDWTQIANADDDTYIVTAYNEGDQYRAKLTPTDPYNKAVNNPTNVSYTATLVTGETEEAVKQATEIALTVTDTHDYTTGDDGTNVVAEFEGQDVTLTASVTYDGKAVTTGYVQFYRDEVKEDNEIGEPVAVNGSSGTATIEATMSSYEKDGKVDRYIAKYLINETYKESVSQAKAVQIRSTAIAWGKLNDTEVMALTIKDLNTNTVLGKNDILVAGHTYQLDLPDVFERDLESNGALTVNKDYRVDWYQFNADATQGELIASLVNLDTVTVKPETDGVGYYAIVTPVDGSDYTKAWTMGKYNNFLITGTADRSDATHTEIELTIDGAVAMGNSWEQYEGRTITLNAEVNVAGSETTMVEHGNVSFYVITESGKSTLIGGQPVAVENGMASVSYELPEYLLNEGLENIEYFYAVYEDVSTELSGEVRYQSSNTIGVDMKTWDLDTADVPAVNQLQVRSIAITWQLNDVKTAIADGANDITIYSYNANNAADGYKGDKLDSVMDADETYVLEMPAVYAYDAVTGTAERLAIGTDYTVQWQYYVEATESWMDYKGKDAYSASIVVTPEYHDYGFRVQVTPKYDNDSLTGFRKAAKYDGNAVDALDFQVLYSDTTVPTNRKGTDTDLTITGADNESKSVMINGNDETFAADHYAQFEGQTVTLKATVTEADAADVMIPTGYVYFYRYEGEGQTVLLNATPVEVKDGIAELEVTITNYDGEKAVTENADKFFAVYEPNDTYDGSTSTTTNAEGAYLEPAETDWVYIKSTSIKTPIVESELPGKIDGKEAKATTYTDDLTELKAGVAHTFELRQEAEMTEEDYSVVALDGRYVEDSNYTIQWLVKNGDNEETTAAENVNPYVTTTTKTGDKYRLWLEPEGDMTVGAYSKYLIVGTKQLVNVTVVASDEIDATEETDVYQLNDITLTATVVGAEEGNSMKPTGKVTFYYSVDEGATWVKIDEAALAEDAVTGDMVATLVTNVLPVDAINYTKEDVTVTAIYEGDETFLVSATFDEDTKAITDTEGSETVDDDVTVYSSVVKRSPMENKPNTPTTAPDGKEGLMAYVDGNLMVNEENVTLMLSDLYTLDGADDTTIEAISKLTHGTDYTIIWQELTNYESYKNADLNDAPWTNLNDSDTHQYNVNVKQGAAYRAMITVKDTAPVQGSFTEVLQADADDATSGSKIYYTNILVPTLGQSTLSYNITTDKFTNFNEEGIVEGEKATVHVYINGATETTPISSLTVSITKEGETKPVFTDTRYSVNGYTAIDWQTKVGDAGYYELKIEAVPSNGYEPETLTRTIIVRDDSYTFNVSNLNPTYNGKTQGVSVAVEGMDIEAALAAKSWTVTYTDTEGNKVEPTQAGEYDYVVTLPASAYWTEKTVEGTFTIEKRQVSVVDLVAQAKVYDGTTNVNLLEIVLEDAATEQSTTGLPSNNWGVINGDSVYATGTGYTASANAGTTELGVKDVELKGDDAHNYVLNSTSYTEDFNIQRNQLQGDVADATYQYIGSSITVPADDIYLIDQQGNVVTDYTITYYYHNGEGVEKVEAMKDLGMYTIVVNKDPANYKGGASQTVYVSDTAQEAAPSKDYHSATVEITNTVELYGKSTGIVATASTGAVSKIAYRVGTEWTTTAPTNAGRYLVKVTTSTDDVAYGIYTIVKARPEVTLTVGETTVVYDSAFHTGNPTTTSSGEGAVYYTYSGDVVIGEHGSDSKVNVDFQGQHDVGTYVVTAHVAETDNYTAHEVSKTFEITPKALTISANDKQRHLYSAYPDMLATYEGLATGGVALDTSLRDIQIMPEFHYDDHENNSESHVGYYTVTPVSALAKNYTVTYVDGEFSVNENDPQPTLAIVGAPQNGKGDGKTYAYYGDVIQLYAYGNQKDGVINKSSVLTWRVVSGNATIDETGKLTINGTGDIVVKLTRGTGRTAISTELTITALKKEVKVIVPNEDVVYSGTEQNYSETAFAVDAYKIDETENVTSINLTDTTRTEVGSQIVDGTVAETETLYQSETYGGLFTINDKEIKIEPNEAETTYGTVVTGLGYTEVTPVNNVAALEDGFAVSVADVYDNLDVLDGYEILVAGRENINYNVKYVTDQVANDVKVNPKDLTITTGSYNGTIAKTEGSVNPAPSYPTNGWDLYGIDLDAAFDTDTTRMYGEPNLVMGYILNGLVHGDSEADLNEFIQYLLEFDDDAFRGIDENANITFESRDKAAAQQTHVTFNGETRDYDLSVDNKMSFLPNYNISYATQGIQNIYQRPVTLKLTGDRTSLSVLYADLNKQTDKEAYLVNLISNNLDVLPYVLNGEEIGGLATLLDHDATDLDYEISFTYTGTEESFVVTIKAVNNYWSEEYEVTINVLKEAYIAKDYTFDTYRKLAYVTIYHVDQNGNETAAYLPGDEVPVMYFYKNEGSYSYGWYQSNGDLVLSGNMTKDSSTTGRYYMSISRLPSGSYRNFAVAEGPGYVIMN